MINTGYDIDVPNRYPAIYRHLKEIGDKFEEENKNKKTKSKGLYKREDQGQNWWNLRACTYMGDFDKQKIIWAEMTDKNSFIWDAEGILANQTCYFIPNASKFLLAALNSKIIYFYFSNFATSLGNGAFRWIKQYVEQIPIPKVQDTSEIKKLVDLVIQCKKNRTDATLVEKKIDLIIYNIYGLNREEIVVIESQ